MAVFGVILIVLAAGTGAAAYWVATSAGATSTTVELFNNQLTLTPLTMFLLGVATMFFLLFGLWMMAAAGRHRVRVSKERRILEKRQREQERELAQTRAKLSATNARSGQATPVTTPTPTSSPAPAPTRAPASGASAAPTERLARPAEAPSTGPRPDGTYEAGKSS